LACQWAAGNLTDGAADAASFLAGETLRRYAQRAVAFDWVGANTAGVAEFKQSFGPVLTPYYRVSIRPAAAEPREAKSWWQRIRRP